jgi:sigma-B regulation protein RsbU (phosphoserine phosphatase)
MMLAPTVESPALARAYCDGVLESYGQDDHSVDARLVVSELVTNAVLHAATEIELNVVVRIDAIRIEVTDLGIDLPHLWAGDDTSGHATRGRGLPIVEALSYAWGVVELGAGKTVWCELALSSAGA